MTFVAVQKCRPNAVNVSVSCTNRVPRIVNNINNQYMRMLSIFTCALSADCMARGSLMFLFSVPTVLACASMHASDSLVHVMSCIAHRKACNVRFIPRLQTWCTRAANIEQTSCTCILNTFASCLLHRVNGVLSCGVRVHEGYVYTLTLYCCTHTCIFPTDYVIRSLVLILVNASNLV